MSMINKPNGYDDAGTWNDTQRLPAGGYAVEIKKAEVGAYDNGNQYIQISFDICEGEYKDYYQNQYMNNSNPDRKYKGRIRVSLPNGNGSEQDQNTMTTLKTNLTAIEESNSGYTFDWNTDSLKGKKAGLLFRNKEYDYQGRHGFWTEPFRFYNIEKIREGKFEIPSDKLLKKKSSNDFFGQQNSHANTSNTAQGQKYPGFEEINDDDIPF